MPLFDTHVVVDWSARSKPSPVKPTKDAIFWCAVTHCVTGDVKYARTRAAARKELEQLIASERAAGRRVLLGFDFPFGYPAGVARHLCGAPSALSLWDWLDQHIEDNEDNSNNRYDVAVRINATYPGVGPMWGRPAAWDHPDVPIKAKDRTGNHPCERRAVEAAAKGSKTVWQLAYAGAVGSQVLLGLPTLKFLRDKAGARVWPFDTGLQAPDADVVLAEVYPSVLQVEAHAARTGEEPLDAAQVRVLAEAFSKADAKGQLAKMFAPEVPDIPAIEREEAWILGVGFQESLKAAITRTPQNAAV